MPKRVSIAMAVKRQWPNLPSLHGAFFFVLPRRHCCMTLSLARAHIYIYIYIYIYTYFPRWLRATQVRVDTNPKHEGKKLYYMPTRPTTLPLLLMAGWDAIGWEWPACCASLLCSRSSRSSRSTVRGSSFGKAPATRAALHFVRRWSDK